jgi:hypothetical protein
MMLGSLFAGLNTRPARTPSAPLLAGDRFVEVLAEPSALRLSRGYRADAVIVLFSLPVCRRADVGVGWVSLAEATREDGCYLSLRFAGSSRPERVAGLDRVGSIREVVLERGGVLSEAAYFGVLTSSPEETLEQGRQSLGKAPGKLNEYTAIDGYSHSGRTRSAITHFRLSSRGDVNARIIAEAHASFQANRSVWRESQWPTETAGEAPSTFLYALMRAIRHPERSTESWYVYSERAYRLRLEKELNSHEGLQFAERGLTSRPGSVLEVRGRIREERGGHQATFRLRIEDGPELALPLRIEFQARSYLRLSFEADPKAFATSLEEGL